MPFSILSTVNRAAVARVVYKVNLPSIPLSFINNFSIYNSLSSNAKSNMKALFAFKLVVSNYTGAVVNLRRADNVSSDFYSDTSGNLYTLPDYGSQSLSNWLSGQNAFVTIWYDQSGLGNNLIQTNTTYQPRIITTDPSGICVYCSSAMPAGSGQLASTTNIISGGTAVVTGVKGLDIFSVFKPTTTLTTNIFCTYTDSTSNSDNGFHSVSGSAYWDVGGRSAYFNGGFTVNVIYNFNGYNNNGLNGFLYKTESAGSRVQSGNLSFSTGSKFGLNYNTSTNYNNHGGTYYWIVTIFSVPLNATNDETVLMNNFP